MDAKPKKLIGKLKSFSQPEFVYEVTPKSVSTVSYSEGVEYFFGKCINGEEPDTEIKNGRSLLEISSDLENGMDVMGTRYYVLSEIAEFIEVRMKFRPSEVKLLKDPDLEKIRGGSIKQIDREIMGRTEKLHKKLDLSEDELETIKRIGTRDEEIIKKMRKMISKRLFNVDKGSLKTTFNCWERDIEVLSWKYKLDYYNLNGGGHIAGYDVNNPVEYYWMYPMLAHCKNEEIKLMLGSESEYYLTRAY